MRFKPQEFPKQMINELTLTEDRRLFDSMSPEVFGICNSLWFHLAESFGIKPTLKEVYDFYRHFKHIFEIEFEATWRNARIMSEANDKAREEHSKIAREEIKLEVEIDREEIKLELLRNLAQTPSCSVSNGEKSNAT